MPIPFTCPHCGKSSTVDDRYAGQSGPCSACGKTITVPYAGMSPAATAGVAAGAATGAGVIIGVIVAVLAGGGCVIAILVALLLPAVQAARTAARRSASQNNLKQISLALLNYHDTYQEFPPAYVTDADGKPLYSWRVLILPFMEQSPLYDRFDKSKAWNDPINMGISTTKLPIYQSPNDTSGTDCNYFVFVGPDTMFPPDKKIKMYDITDGTSNTIAVIETTGVAGSWAAPIDPAIDRINLQIGRQPGQIQPVYPGGTNAAMADGSVRFISENVDSETLRRLLIRNDGQVVPLDY